MFDWEHGIALHAMQGNQASSLGKGTSHGFSGVAAGTWDIFFSDGVDGHSKFVFVQQRQHSWLVTMNTLRI